MVLKNDVRDPPLFSSSKLLSLSRDSGMGGGRVGALVLSPFTLPVNDAGSSLRAILGRRRGEYCALDRKRA
jgi:hypothetical protein